MKKPRIAFCPADNNNLKYFKMLEASLRKFHTEEELPLLRVENPTTDTNFWYLATPLIGSKLLEEYETVIKIDSDTIICGDLSHLWKDTEFDVATVLNSSPREFEAFPYQFMNIPATEYFNCGLVVMKNPEFVKHWLKLCQSWIFPACQMREQDLLNIMCLMDWNVRNLDDEDKFHGLASKGYWSQIELVPPLQSGERSQLILDMNEEWPLADKQIVAIHVAGGNNQDKMKLRPYFKPEVIKFLEDLTETKI